MLIVLFDHVNVYGWSGRILCRPSRRTPVQIWDNYANRPKFLFTSLIEAHEGSGAHIGAVDEDLAQFMDRAYHTV